jgi:DUF971 family protein
METKARKETEYVMELRFKNSHEASVFQAMMVQSMGDKLFAEYKEEIKTMAGNLYDLCLSGWK